MGMTLCDQVFGDLALGEEGIGREVFTFQIDRVQ